MYYEEEIVNGILCYRTKPDEDWRAYRIQELSLRVARADMRIRELEAIIAKQGVPNP